MIQWHISTVYFSVKTAVLVYIDTGILKTTIEQDLAAIKPLSDYTPESIVVIEIPEDDIETQEKLNRCKTVSLDIETNELIFEFAPEEEEEIRREATLEEQMETTKQSIAELSAIVATMSTPEK